MKKFLSLGLASVLAVGLATSCKDDVLNGGELGAALTEDDGKYMYVTAGIALPTAGNTRSATEDSGYKDEDDNNKTNSDANKDGGYDYEYGYDYENTVRSVLLVFANEKFEYVTHSVINGITAVPGQNLSKNYDLEVVGEIKHEALQKAYGENGVLSGEDKIVYAFAFCNYTARMLERFQALAAGTSTEEDKWYNWEGLVEEDPSPAGYTPLTQNSIWSGNSFLMANARECKIEFPDDITKWDEYADRSTPFRVAAKDDTNLKPIYVERVAARLDFKDGSKGETPNTYPLYVDSNNNNKLDERDLNIISVQLNRMCLVNMAKHYYYLRRTSPDGTNTNTGMQLGGTETSKNFVVDYDWQAKKGDLITAENEHDYYNFPLYTTETQSDDESEGVKYNRFGWYTDRIQEDFLKPDDQGPTASKDTWKGSSAGGGYYIWRYVTENTLPTVETQQTKQSTGIVFKGRIVPGKDMEEEDASKYMSEKVIRAIERINEEDFGKSKSGSGIAKEYDDLLDEDKEDVPFLYSYNTILYAGHEEFLGASNNDGSNGPLHQVANHILQNWVLKDATDVSGYEAANSEHKPVTGTITKVYVFDPEEAAKAGAERMTVEAWMKITKKDGDTPTPEYFLVDDGQEYRDYIINADDFQNVAPDSNVTVYRPYNEDEYDINGEAMGDGWGYYCYYFYWNRHNDNGKSGLMGPMEFATVRNNVYKLSVTSISQLGHPRMRSFDPDPVDPDDPDEDPTNYIQVEINVLPWVVRENNITF